MPVNSIAFEGLPSVRGCSPRVAAAADRAKDHRSARHRRRDDAGVGAARHRPERHRQERQRLHGFLRLRERHLAREPSDPGLHGSLEPALGIGRDQQGARARHPDRGLHAQGLADRQRRAALRRFLRRVHGRDAGQRSSARSPCSRCSTRSARSRRAPTCSTRSAHLHDIGVAVPFGIAAQQDLHDPTQVIAHVDGRRPRPAGSRLLPQARKALRRSAREVPRRTSRTCSSSPAPSRRRRSRPRRRCSRSRSGSPRPRSTTSRCAIRKQQDHKTTFADLAEDRAGLRLGRVLRRREDAAQRTST